MKKLTKLAMLGAVALTSTVIFTACSSDEEVAVNPTFDGSSVKTEFTISIPRTAKTRMTAGDAQEDNVFSGMKNIKLYPFSTATAVAGTEVIATAPIALEDLTNSGLNETGSSNGFNGKVYNDVVVPVGTQTFLFYGQKTSTADGELSATYPTNDGSTVADIHFDMVSVQGGAPSSAKVIDAMSADTEGTKVLAALNSVSASLSAQATDATTAAHSSAAALTDLNTLFQTNTAGSANTVKAMLEDLSAVLGTIAGSYASAVKTVVDTQITNITSLTFPGNLGLPDGAVGVKSTSGTFAFGHTNTNGLGQPALNTYVKPAELFYTVNTPLHADITVHQPQYASQAAWTNVVGLYGSNTAVSSTTRGIVLDKEIQYAVARLQSNVAINLGGAAKLQANDGVDGTTLIDINNTSFTVTGVLVGSQNNVDWKFQPTTAGNYVVYDPVQTSTTTVSTSAASAYNNTLVMETVGVPNPDNAVVATTNDEVVQVAIELQNDGDDFYGYNDELIPSGTKFYLVAELKVSDAASGSLKKIFQQDYTTTVNFTIGKTSLKNAYSTIPDLRSPELELGLAVNLQWQAGLTFNTTFQ